MLQGNVPPFHNLRSNICFFLAWVVRKFEWPTQSSSSQGYFSLQKRGPKFNVKEKTKATI
jgi:hypothetical protein